MDDPNASVLPKMGTKDKSVGWYDKDFPGMEPAARKLLEEYSGIPRGEVDRYVIAMRDKAWDIFPYPCIGQFRLHDGAPGDNLHGAELQGEFIHQARADAFDLGDGSPLRGLVVHLFSWEKQRDLLESCVQLLRPATSGAMILGQAVGGVEGGMWPGGQIFIHSVETFNKMWAEISQRTGLKFKCKAILDEGLGIAESRRGWDGATRKRLSFEVEPVD